MSVLKKSAAIVAPTQIVAYNNIVRNVNLIPSNVSNFQLTYGTILSIATDDDISNITFTLTGSFNGFPIQEQIQGPNAGSTVSIYFYDKISSLIASDNSNAVVILSTGERSIVVFDSYNTINANNFNYNNINVLVKSIAAGAGWGQARNDNGNPIGCFIYGVSAKRPDIITNSYVIPNIVDAGIGYPNNSYLTFINNIADNITQNTIQNGYFTSTTYPYYSIIVYISGVLQSLTFLEIAQS